ncbi:MAG: ankyrin repeat domain-containing protein, partial [Deferribacteraceae bacterium]|nr:ankyrin repeat domain-containing protein [Deferribacteraceae bacterium]
MFYAVIFFLLFLAAQAMGQVCGTEALNLLLDNSTIYANGVAVKDRLFITSAANGQEDLAEKLAANPALLNETDPTNGNNALLAAIISGHKDSSERLLSSGINLKHTNKNGQNALHLSAKAGDALLAEKLIAKGLSVSSRDNYGNTPLLYAAASYNPQTVIELLRGGANSSERNNDNLTPLSVATLRGNTANAAALLDAQAAADHITPCGTPLGIAIKMKNRVIFNKLLEAGASTSLADMNGDSPLHIAAASEDINFAQRL